MAVTVPERRGFSVTRGPGAFSLLGLPWLLLAVLLAAQPVGAQQWNGPRALELIERARERRAAPYADSALRNYRAEAHGRIYFFLDREDTDERTLVRTDQVALEVFWAYPGRTKQRIIGLRDESALPNRMRYHLDHLTVVQNEFGNLITLGDGDEVRAVPHPVAPGSGRIYDFRLADSLTLRVAGLSEPLRVYDVQVRPRDPSRPAFVGSVFVDRATGDIVRLDFTFTPASYVDERLDYIRISLENGLWQGRFWLPYQQRAELRRQVPLLDFPAGGVIRLDMRVGGYEFNQPLPPGIFRGPRVTAVPEDERRAYPFEEGLYADLEEEGLEPDPDLDRLAEEASSLLRENYVSGLPRLRLDVRGASSVLRYNRVEELVLGGGLSYGLGSGAEARAGFGWAFGLDRPQARASLALPLGAGALSAWADYNQPADLSPTTIAGALNTLSSLAAAADAEFGHDFLDLYFTRGGGLAYERDWPAAGRWARVGVEVSEHRTAQTFGDGYEPVPGDELKRPVVAVADGTMVEGRLDVRATSELPDRWMLRASVRPALFERDFLTRFDAVGELGYGLPTERRTRARLHAGFVAGHAIPQRLHYLGGRGTLPGHEYRAFAGTVWALLEAEAEWPLVDRRLTARLLGAAGWSSFHDERPLTTLQSDTGGLKGSIGIGAGLIHDILRLDLHHGLGGGGDWEVLLSVSPRLHDIL